MRKKASARLKNKIKHLVARSIAQMERSIGNEKYSFRNNKKKK